MVVEAHVTINGSRPAVWAAITDIAGAQAIISGVKNIEIMSTPANGLVGLRWRETRILFGKPATVEKWITQAADNISYETRAESDGFVFVTTMRISDDAGGVRLTSSHDSQPQTTMAKLQAIPMALFFKGVVKKAILQDLNDIKGTIERR